MNMPARAGIILLSLGVAAACSNRAVYDSVQAHQRLECQKAPVSQQEECMQQVEKSYEQYERERKELEQEE